jgi:hypothetical protein
MLEKSLAQAAMSPTVLHFIDCGRPKNLTLIRLICTFKIALNWSTLRPPCHWRLNQERCTFISLATSDHLAGRIMIRTFITFALSLTWPSNSWYKSCIGWELLWYEWWVVWVRGCQLEGSSLYKSYVKGWGYWAEFCGGGIKRDVSMETGAMLKFQVHQRMLSPTSSRPAPARRGSGRRGKMWKSSLGHACRM